MRATARLGKIAVAGQRLELLLRDARLDNLLAADPMGPLMSRVGYLNGDRSGHGRTPVEIARLGGGLSSAGLAAALGDTVRRRAVCSGISVL